MNYPDAECIISRYVDATATTHDGSIAKKEAWLPCSKNKIVIAYKIFMAHVILYKTLTKEEFDQYLMLLNMIDSFVSDDEAKIINNFYSLNNEEIENIRKGNLEQYEFCLEYNKKIAMSDKHDDVVYFIQDVQKLDINDPLYCQKVYSLANLEYRSEYKSYFEGNRDIKKNEVIQLGAFASLINFLNQYIVIMSMVATIVGIIGFFINNTAFYIGGLVSFILSVLYITINTYVKDIKKIEEIKTTKSFQRTRNSQVYYADTDEQISNLIKQFMIGSIVGRILSYGLSIGIILYFFRLSGFVWIGIAFGLFYIPEVIKSLTRRQSQSHNA